MNQYFTFRQFRSLNEAESLIKLLEHFNINYQINDISSTTNVYTHTNYYDLEDKVAVLIDKNDEDKVLKIIEENVLQSKELIESSFLNDFTDEELLDILVNKKEWIYEEYIIARQLLKNRGVNISDDSMKSAIYEKLANEQTQKTTSTPYFIILLIITILTGGLSGIIIGITFNTAKKRLYNDEVMYVYDAKSQHKGSLLILVGTVCLLILLVIFFLNYIQNS